jgi:hypothetical protein
MKTVETNHGPMMVGKVGEFSQLNAETSGYVPGRTLILKGSKLHESGDYLVTPYTEKTVLVRRSPTLALCCINSSSWYIFSITMDDKGRETIATSKTFRKGFNDNESAVSEAFQKQVEEYERKQQQAEAAAIAQKETDRINAETIARKTEVKSRLLAVQTEIQKLSSNRKAKDIMTDTVILTLLGEYSRLEVLLKIRAL